jgi:hypothetical protein
MMAPYHHICSSRVSVSTPIKRGKTGMMRPMPRASRKMQAYMNLSRDGSFMQEKKEAVLHR